MKKKTVVVLGASTNPGRISNQAVKRLADAGYNVVAIGRREGSIGGVPILAKPAETPDVYAVTLYLNAANQVPYYPYILSLKPGRIIFNPGAENPELDALATLKGIQCEHACTLVMLSTGQF